MDTIHVIYCVGLLALYCMYKWFGSNNRPKH